MPPKFPLQPVLDFRKVLVDRLEVELAHLLSAGHRLRNRITTNQAAQQAVLAELRTLQSGLLNLEQIQRQQTGWQILHDELQRLAAEMRTLQNAVHEKRAELVAAAQRRDVVAKLGERHAGHWQAELLRHETAERDDIYIARAFNRRAA